MKIIKTVLFTCILSMLTFFSANAQDTPKFVEMTIKTSAVCNMCKETLESSLALEKGIKRLSLDVKTAVLTVVYSPKKTTPEKIRMAVSKVGYDADEVLADPAAYEKLSSCCKKNNVTH